MDAGVNTRCGPRSRLGGARGAGCGRGSVAAGALGPGPLPARPTDPGDDRRTRGRDGSGRSTGGNSPQAAVLHVIVIVIAANIEMPPN